jgi:NADPH:quinone reductase-like Zn-dependent oxidoreductase
MKAIVWTRYGSPDGLQLRDVPRPTPKDTELLIKVHATAVTAADTELRRLKLPLLFAVPLRLYLGFIRPTRMSILGTDFAGEVVSAGKYATRHRAGDQVFGYTGLRMGTYAEYLCLPEGSTALAGVLAEKPAHMTYEEAAAVPFGGLEALHSLRQANIQPGQTVLIVGAGGSIGTYAVQLAKHHGAEVTAVDKPGKFEMLRSIGADHFVDYTQGDVTQTGQMYDVILDTAGKTSFSRSLRTLKEGGTYLNASPGVIGALRSRWASKRGSQRIVPWTAGYTVSNLLALKALIEAGSLHAVIDRRYPLDQIAEAHRYVETGQKKGNVVVTLGQTTTPRE